MDIPRESKKKKKPYIIGGIAVILLIAATLAISSLEPAAPSVDHATIWSDTVERGTMVRQVRAPGTLVPEEIRLIPAVTAGRVERKLVEPGTRVDSATVLVELSNPEVQLELLEAERQLSSARAQLVSLRTSLNTQRLNQAGVVATTRAEYLDAKRTAENAKKLAADGLISSGELSRARERADEYATRLEIEEERLQIFTESIESQLAVQRGQVRRLENIVEFHKNRLASMRVVAGSNGVLLEMPLEEGEWVLAGYTLARVVKPERLKAVLRVPQVQARDVALAQSVIVDTRNDTIQGRVTRIDPAVQEGTVAVDVSLQGKLPPGARPDLSVDGTIEIERLEDVLYVGRPAYGQSNSTVGLFRLTEDGDHAQRVTVRLGRSSVNTIEIVEGLAVGDVVILSDMSQWDQYDRVRIK